MKGEFDKSAKGRVSPISEPAIRDILFGEPALESPDQAATEAVRRIWSAVESGRNRNLKTHKVLDAKA